MIYGLEGVRAQAPEIVVVRGQRKRTEQMVVHHCEPRSQMIRTFRGWRVTGIEATLVALASELEAEAFEIACEDARRRQLTSVPALRAYIERHGHRPGIAALRRLLGELDPVHPSRSTLEVKTRRLLVAHGITDFVREFPLTWDGRTYYFDFALGPARVILETNGRRWHDDAADYEDDNEKWSVPGRLGHRIVFATWNKVDANPHAFIDELRTALLQPAA